eukprot:148379-Chlamydomonas_euryale.AAC.1
MLCHTLPGHTLPGHTRLAHTQPGDTLLGNAAALPCLYAGKEGERIALGKGCTGKGLHWERVALGMWL